MTKAEWTLWITSTFFQGIIAWEIIVEAIKMNQLRKKIEAQSKTMNKTKVQEAEVVA